MAIRKTLAAVSGKRLLFGKQDQPDVGAPAKYDQEISAAGCEVIDKDGNKLAINALRSGAEVELLGLKEDKGVVTGKLHTVRVLSDVAPAPVFHAPKLR